MGATWLSHLAGLANQRSAMFIHELKAGAKWSVKRWCRSSRRLISGVW